MHWDTDKIIGSGLIFALWLYMVIVCAVVIACGKTLPLDPASNIIACLAGYMGRTLAERRKQDAVPPKPKEEEKRDADIHQPRSRPEH